VELALVLYALFAILAVTGLYLIGKNFHSTAMGYKLATGGVVFFILLVMGMVWLLYTYGD